MVGAHLCDRLRADGWRVRALVRDPAKAGWLAATGVELARGDTLDRDSLVAATGGCDAVLHAAAAITPSGGWESFRRPNVEGTANVLHAAEAARARLLHVSSVAVYGPGARYRADGAPLDEEGPLAPLPEWAFYARSKRESEEMVMAAHRAGRVWATAVRPCVVYGRHDRQFVPRIARLVRLGVVPVLRGGRSTLSVVHAANVADAAIRALTREVAGGRAYNVANDFPVTVASFFRLAGDGLGRRVRLLPLPVPVAVGALALVRAVTTLGGRSGVATMARSSVDFLGRDNPFSSDRARRELGWAPAVRHEDGVPDAFRWWRAWKDA